MRCVICVTNPLTFSVSQGVTHSLRSLQYVSTCISPEREQEEDEKDDEEKFSGPTLWGVLRDAAAAPGETRPGAGDAKPAADAAPPAGGSGDGPAAPAGVTLEALTESIRRVREGPPCLTSICLYSVVNTHQGWVYAAGVGAHRGGYTQQGWVGTHSRGGWVHTGVGTHSRGGWVHTLGGVCDVTGQVTPSLATQPLCGDTTQDESCVKSVARFGHVHIMSFVCVLCVKLAHACNTVREIT